MAHTVPSRLSATLSGVLALVLACGGTSSPPATGPDPGGPGPASTSIPAVQGAAHVSPMLDREVEVTGVVTARRGPVFHLQDPEGDGDPATSDAVLVTGAGTAPSVGDRVRVTGTVDERRPGDPGDENLTVTVIRASATEALDTGSALPPPVRLAVDGRLPPEVRVIGPDELPVDLADPDEAAATPFEPAEDGIDFYESLEAMRVRAVRPVAVSPVERFGPGEATIWTLAERGEHVTPDDVRTFRGGILLATDADNRGDHNPERIAIRIEPGTTPGDAPAASVGAELADVTGVLGYDHGNYGVVATTPVEVVAGAGAGDETTDLVGDGGRVTVATYNVLNLNPRPETADRMERLGRHVARDLGAPDVVALQEIQDGNGTRGGEGNTETDATETLRALVDAIERAGGPEYAFGDVAPEPNSSGGVPGGNIRNAFLWRTDRVEMVDLRSVTPDVLEAAGARDPAAFEGGRDPLAATFAFGGRRFTVVNNHFSSRFGSTPVFGAVHPFEQAGERAREAQSRAVHDYVEHLLAEGAGAGVVVLGDLNTFEYTDDLTRLLPGPAEEILENLVCEVPGAERYSYNFQGNSQTLDHVFVTEGLRGDADADLVHLNADVPAAAAASDHDPMVVRLAVP